MRKTKRYKTKELKRKRKCQGNRGCKLRFDMKGLGDVERVIP